MTWYPQKDGLEGFELALRHIPDLIISDLLMPGMTGFELCDKIRKHESTSHVLFFLLTVKSSDDHGKKGFELGADQYITKPFDPALLLSSIGNALQKRMDYKKKILNRKTLRLQPQYVEMTSRDEQLLNQVMHIIESNISNSDFSVEDLSRELGFSKSQLYRKMKATVGQSANEFIRAVRMKRAAQLLEQNVLTINEITYKVGFNDLHYFRTCFKKEYGVNPSKYGKKVVAR